MKIYEMMERWEQLLENTQKRKKIAIVVLLLVSIGYINYTFLIEPTIEEVKAKQSQLKTLENKISHHRAKYLEEQIALLKKNLLKKRTEIERLKRQKYEVMRKLQKQNKIFYSQQNFSRFLDKMLAASVTKDILIDIVGLKKIKEPYLGKLQAVREIEVNGSANFINFIRFLREIEDRELLFKVDEVTVEQKEDIPAFFYKIKFFGVEN